jgi:hypothetical protein
MDIFCAGNLPAIPITAIFQAGPGIFPNGFISVILFYPGAIALYPPFGQRIPLFFYEE